jgi:pheromone shutdown-related protein TraB
MTDAPTTTASLEQTLADQPVRIVQRDGVRYTLLGTAHVSPASVAAVEAAIGSGQFDAVAVELDAQRLGAMEDPDALAKMDLVEVIRKGRVPLFAANLALAAYQRRLAEQLKIEPGAELKRAVTAARERDLPVQLIDREVGLTFRRASRRLGLWGKLQLISGIGAGLLSKEEVGEAEIEKLKQGDMLESSFGDFAEQSPALYDTVIAERDRYMAARLREESAKAATPLREVLAVVGAGHLAGLARHLAEDQDDASATRTALEDVPVKRNIPWFTLIILAVIVGGIVYGFASGGMNMGAELLATWALLTGGLAGVGCLLARGHPLSILTAMAAAPFKPFRLSIPTGAFSSLVEARLRKPAYADFMALRDDTQSIGGWYRNRITRVLLVFLLTNLGSASGLWLTIARFGSRLAS